MKKLLILASLALLFTLVSAQASPLCTSAADNKLSTLRALGSCQIGDFDVRFNTVGISGQPGNNSSTTVMGSGATVEAGTLVTWSTSGPTDLAVTFSVLPTSPLNLTLNGTHDLGVAQGFNQAAYTFNYTVTPINPGYAIYALQYDATGVKAPAGLVTGYKQIKDENGDVVFQLSFADVILTAGPTSTTSGTGTFAATLGRTFVQDTLTLTQLANGGALLTTGTLTNTLSFQPVPEPMSMVLAGAGLIGLGVLRRRRKA
jgi:hypothetical protein